MGRRSCSSISIAPPPSRSATSSPRRLRDAIRLGSLRAGVRLPASRVLAAELRVSRGVVVEAYDELHAQGFLRVAPRSAPVVVAVPGAPRQKAPDPPPRAPLVDFSIETVDTALFDRRSWLRAYGAALDAAPGAALAYGDPRGQSDLRVALADYLGRARAVAADPRDVVVCQGSIQGVQLAAAAAACGPGVRRVALEDPCGDELRAAVVGAGLEPVAAADRRARPGRRCARGRRRRRGVPHARPPVPGRRHAAARAPAGAAALGARCRRAAGGGRLRRRAALRPPAGRRAAGPGAGAGDYIGTASRTLVPALRLGWIVVPPQLADDAGALRWELGGASPSLDQLAFARLLTSAAFERGVRRLRVEYARPPDGAAGGASARAAPCRCRRQRRRAAPDADAARAGGRGRAGRRRRGAAGARVDGRALPRRHPPRRPRRCCWDSGGYQVRRRRWRRRCSRRRSRWPGTPWTARAGDSGPG